MYLEHFGLQSTPFALTPNPRFLFLTRQHREALAALLFGVTERKGFVVITGEAGTGKTTLMQKMFSCFPEESLQLSVITNPTLTRAELFESVLLNFGVKQIPSSKALRLAVLKDLLVANDQTGKVSVLVIDEAHLLGPELIEEIRLLSNLETPERKLLQIILTGQQELKNVLNLPSMTQVKQRIALRMHLEPLSREDVERYIKTRWSRASGGGPVPFRLPAIDVIARVSRGIPRIINVLCDGALINACGSGKTDIGPDDLSEVIRDLELEADAPVATPTNSTVVAPSAPELAPAPFACASPVIGAVERYVPERIPRERKLFRLGTWFRSVQTGVE